MIRENLAFLKKSSDVRRCYVYVVRQTAAMTSPLTNKNLTVNVWTNAYWNRAATDHWKRIGESWSNDKRHFEQKRISNKEPFVATYEQVKKDIS